MKLSAIAMLALPLAARQTTMNLTPIMLETGDGKSGSLSVPTADTADIPTADCAAATSGAFDCETDDVHCSTIKVWTSLWKESTWSSSVHEDCNGDDHDSTVSFPMAVPIAPTTSECTDCYVPLSQSWGGQCSRWSRANGDAGCNYDDVEGLCFIDWGIVGRFVARGTDNDLECGETNAAQTAAYKGYRRECCWEEPNQPFMTEVNELDNAGCIERPNLGACEDFFPAEDDCDEPSDFSTTVENFLTNVGDCTAVKWLTDFCETAHCTNSYITTVTSDDGCIDTTTTPVCDNASFMCDYTVVESNTACSQFTSNCAHCQGGLGG